ncbi:oxygen-independent coproporphyrinogen III oxidase [Halomonas sp. YLGW01]|uniref:oxygen-independent coproporphyrinogen III oxidase n=1 Tax=Halomonas sp. YLGW01 TaxID=2773308 RepID=UPI001784C523|nr:oxygen-independent coproporphyrinogen III oxidase [Halomonas sp. YLGW01]
MSSSTPTTRPAPSSSRAWDPALLKRYDINGPRYTSYPTAPSFHDDFGAEDYEAALSRSNASHRPLSLYVHVPFCRRICFYCACNKIATKNTRLAEPYLSRLDREMVLTSRQLDTSREVTQLHWGGGTPTFLTLGQMSDLIDRLEARFGLSSSPERDYAIEIDPREADVLTLRHLQALGFNRLSLGVQDLDPTVQRAINRVQPRVLTETLIDEARRLGFRSLNLDLIYGLPHQTPASFAATLSQVIEMAPARLSVFNYAHLPSHFAPQRRIREADLPDSDAKLAMLQATIEMLEDAGYAHLGMDHFARPDDSLARAQRQGTMTRNFQGYSTHGDSDLVGLGVSAISRVDDGYAQNPTALADYETALDAGRLATAKGIRLSLDDRLRRRAIERLMCDRHLDLAALGREFQVDATTRLADALARLTPAFEDELIEQHGHRLTVTPRGRLLIRHLAMAFDAHLPQQTTQRFSRIL